MALNASMDDVSEILVPHFGEVQRFAYDSFQEVYFGSWCGEFTAIVTENGAGSAQIVLSSALSAAAARVGDSANLVGIPVRT